MNTAIWANLFWKEWREHQWKLAALTAILFGTFLAIWLVDWREGPLAASWIIMVFYTPLAALFIGMGIAAGEHSRGTLDGLRRLPATMRATAVTKLLVGLVTVVLPGLGLIACDGLIVASGWQDVSTPIGPFSSVLGSGLWWFEAGLVFLLASGSLLIWAAAIGVNQATELRAGALALIVTITVWTVAMLAESATRPPYDNLNPTAFENHCTLRATIIAALPGGNISLFPPGNSAPQYVINARLIGVPLAFLVHVLLVAWWVVSYGRAAVRIGSEATPVARTNTASAWLRPPRRGRVEAVLWKQFREAAPIIGGVVALAAGWAAFIFIAEVSRNYSVNEISLAWGVWIFAWMTTLCGFLAALMVGIGGFQDDLNPGTSTFWRSRPIPPTLFFWLKYAGGLVALAVVFGGALLASYLVETGEVVYRAEYVMLGIVLCLLTYATAAMLSCLVRNAIYAAILAIFPAGYGAVVAFSDEWPFVWASRLIVLVVACVAVSVLGWLAMRNDWSLSRG